MVKIRVVTDKQVLAKAAEVKRLRELWAKGQVSDTRLLRAAHELQVMREQWGSQHPWARQIVYSLFPERTTRIVSKPKSKEGQKMTTKARAHRAPGEVKSYLSTLPGRHRSRPKATGRKLRQSPRKRRLHSAKKELPVVNKEPKSPLKLEKQKNPYWHWVR